jgi:putative transposase
MARLARVVVADVAHHVTQRGNGRQFLLASDSERMVYLDLLRQAVQVEGVRVVGYCLMSNHVHLVLIPRRAEALAVALKQTHGRYAAYWNAAHASRGHAWQGRFYSCPLDEAHLWQALRYAELNPVRAGMASEAGAWPWSSAAAHCGTASPDACLEMSAWRRRWSEESWRRFLEAGETQAELDALRRCTHTGRPLGSGEFVGSLESHTERRLAPQKGGRPRKPVADPRQIGFAFPKRTRQAPWARPKTGKN